MTKQVRILSPSESAYESGVKKGAMLARLECQETMVSSEEAIKISENAMLIGRKTGLLEAIEVLKSVDKLGLQYESKDLLEFLANHLQTRRNNLKES